MSTVPAVSTITHAMFQTPLKGANMRFAHSVLLYIKRRPDCTLGTVGDRVEYLLRKGREVPEKYMVNYYQMLSHIIATLIKYAQLEEMCSNSGYYQKDREANLKTLTRLMNDLEVQDDVFEHLNGMTL